MDSALPPVADILVETPWETRNLERPSFEVAQEQLAAADFDALAWALGMAARKHGRMFVHARLPMRWIDRMSLLQRLGFYVVECSLRPRLKLAGNTRLAQFLREPDAFVPRRFRRRRLALTQLKPNAPDTALVRSLAAVSFQADRFHLDFRCPTVLASRRFRLWIDDLLADTAVRLHLLHLDDQPIGFFAHRRDHLVLSGFIPSYAGAGLGEYFWWAICAKVQADGFGAAHSCVSCNNLPSLNLFTRMGFRFGGTAYSLHLWR
jgi:ribosomal protein S18 acetylase RimI-like enzyme